MLVRRLGYEIEQRLRGARVTDLGLLPDGRTAVALRSRGAAVLLAVDLHAPTPLVTLEEGELGIAVEPGFVRAAAAALRGMALIGVRARRGDRLLRLTFASRSRFGVGDELDLYLELVPRFGNAVLVKREVVVAAAKEFSPADNARRSVEAGRPYALPPLPPESSLVPRLVAQSGADRDAFLAYAQGDAVLTDALYVYRRDGNLVQAHVVPLSGFDDAACAREPSLLNVLGAVRAQASERAEHDSSARRRHALERRLTDREQKLRTELVALTAKRAEIAERGVLRAEGEGIFATLHELHDGARDDAKERAGKLFARYRKLGAATPHVERREKQVRAFLDGIDALRWETERVAPEDIGELEVAIAAVDGRGGRAATPPQSAPRRRKRALLEFRTNAGSRIVVGRSPAENADITFRIARPGDLWFHTRGIPGAHVVLSRDDRNDAPAADVEAAAALAAHYSKAKNSAKVAVDYTQRKHVRKQRDAAPGLVWYTQAKTIVVAPQASLSDT